MRRNVRYALLFAFAISHSLFAGPVNFATRKAIDLASPVITLADINKDGKTDIVAATIGPNGDYEVNIQLGRGNGTFTQGPTVDLGAGFIPIAIATGDFNGDGLMDVVVLSNATRSVYILTQQAVGFSINPIQIAEDTSQAQTLSVGDLNGDHLPDIVIPSAAGAVLLLSSGGGNFHSPILANSNAVTAAILADVNNDKHLDLVLTNSFCCSSSYTTVLLGDGHGGFDAPLSQPSVNEGKLIVVDLNLDGKLDLAGIPTNGGNTVNLLFGNGDGTFAPPVSFLLPSQAQYGINLASGDLNGDGIPDLAVLTNNGSVNTSLITFLNTGKGSFGPPSAYPVAFDSNYLALANLNGDKYMDAVVSPYLQGSAVSILLNEGNGALLDGEVISTAQQPQFMVSGDFNGDGKPDLATVNQSTGLTVLLNNGNNKQLFSPEAALPFYTGPLVAGDFNNDHREDLVVLNNNGSGETLLGNGAGSFTLAASSFSTGVGTPAAVAADMNGDGNLDIVTTGPTVNLGNGDGTFRPPAGFTNFCYGPGAVAVADFNQDGKPDVVTGCQGSVSVYLGNGDGTLNYPVFFEYVNGLQSIAVGDFNRDGIADIAFTSAPNFFLPNSTGVTILIGQGNGYFSQGTTIPVLTAGSGLLVAAQFDGNAYTDLAVLDSSDSVFSILRGNGDGTFQLPQLFGTGTAPSCIVSGRFRSGTLPGEQDLAFCTGQGVAVDINTTK